LVRAPGVAPHPTTARHSSRIDTNFVLRISPQERSKLGSCFDLRPGRTQSFALGFLAKPGLSGNRIRVPPPASVIPDARSTGTCLRGVFQPNDFEFGVIVDSQQYLITFCIDLTDQHGIGEGAGKAWSPQTAERSTRKMNYDELEKLRERLVQASQHRPRSKVQEILDRLLGRVDAKLKLKPQPKSISEKDDRGKAA
jgi:hypothetical protein